jgi:hypothetical protein
MPQDAGTLSMWQCLAGLKCDAINPLSMMDKRLLTRLIFNQSKQDSVLQLPPSEISFSNADMPDISKFFEDSKIITAPDTKEQPSERARCSH